MSFHTKLLVYTTFAALCLTHSNIYAQFPSLNLVPALPDISSPAQIDITYTFNAGTGIGALTAFGGASQLNLPPSQAIIGGVFDLNATIDTNNATATGSLTINGTSPGFSGPLLTASTLSAFGAGADDPLEFVFDNLGGSAATTFGPGAGVILSATGFSGSLTQDFGTVGAFPASATTFGIPEPGTTAMLLWGGGALVVGLKRRRQRS